MRSRLLFIIFVAALFIMIAATAAQCMIFFITTSGSDSNSGSSWGNAKRTITAALAAASNGDQIWVEKGAYYERINLKLGVQLYGGFVGNESNTAQRPPFPRSEDDPNNTILNGEKNGSVVTCDGGAVATTRLDGFMITYGESDYGAGIYLNHTNPTIANNTLYLNSANKYGAGIYCLESFSQIVGNLIKMNGATERGGGIYIVAAWPTINGNIFDGNGTSSNGRGGGICCENCPEFTISNNFFSDNQVSSQGIGYGGGIYCGGTSLAASPNIVNNTIYSSTGEQIYCDNNTAPKISNNIVYSSAYEGIMNNGGNPVLRNNLLFQNHGGNYVGISPGIGDIGGDPGLLDTIYGELHLMRTSRCINAGWNNAPGITTSDIDGEQRIRDGIVDIGADECWSKNIYVSTISGNDINNGLSWNSARKTIASGLTIAKPGDEIWVAKGTYNERITLKGSAALYGGFAGNETSLTQRPAFPRPSPDPNETIIDGGQGGTVVTSPLEAGETTRLDGFTIQNGQAPYGGGISCIESSPSLVNSTIRQNLAAEGGGIYCNEASPFISSNVITQNTATNNGGGINCNGFSFPEISWNLITSNNAQNNDGGAIYSASGAPIIHHNRLIGNTALQAGAGIRCWKSNADIVNNIIALNTSQYGGGIHLHQCSQFMNVINNTITANISTAFGGGIDCFESPVQIRNNIVSSNTGGIGKYGTGDDPTLLNNDVFGNWPFYQYFTLTPGPGDIDADPLFVDWAGGDYHLTYNSPCINKGSSTQPLPYVDIDGQQRILQTIDIGADEYSTIFSLHVVTINIVTATPASVASGGTTMCGVNAEDNFGHDVIYQWSDGGVGGNFSNPIGSSTIYTVPSNTSGYSMAVNLTCTVTCTVDPLVTDTKSTLLTVLPTSTTIPGDFNGSGQITISDATLFVNEWVRMHQTPPPAFDPAIDGPFDLYPHTAGVWPDWTPIGDGVINISDATAFIQCWTGSHPPSPASAVPMRANEH